MKKIKAKDKLHYTGCGLDYIYLMNGFDLYEDEDGDMAYAIHSADRLHETIAYAIITEVPHLRGMELRFLRSFLHISQASMAKCLKRSRDSIAKMEADLKKELPDQTEALLRVFVMGHLKENTTIKKMINILQKIEDMEENELILENHKDKWDIMAA
ncbi:MAG: hypothetical protein KDI13_00160 [Alphaproteobacteria bacterium]|nr:hypothetical protein [Alphaproteobacteria bacterium]